MSETQMTVMVEDISPVKKKLSFTISWEEAKREMDSVFSKIGKTAKIKGFRQGKVPRPILETYYGDYAKEETVNNLMNRYFWDALEEKAITPLAKPSVEPQALVADQPFGFTATVEVEPVLEPQDYTGIDLEKAVADVTEDEIDAQLQELREMYAVMEDVVEDRALAAGDYALIDFQGYLGGKPQKDMKADDYTLEIGSRSFIPGFEDQVVGMKKGETKDIAVTFPADYHAKALAGKETTFTVSLKAIKEKKLPPIDDDFIKNFEKFETLAALKDQLRLSLQQQNETKADVELRDKLLAALLERNVFEVPDVMVERQIYYLMIDTSRRMAMRGMDPKAVAGMLPQYRDLYREDATRMVRTQLLLKRIAEKEGIAVDDAEVEAEIRELAKQRGQTVENVRKSLEKDDLLDSLHGELLHRKAVEFMIGKSNVSVVKKAAEPVEKAVKPKRTKKAAEEATAEAAPETESAEKPKRVRKTAKKEE